MSFTRLSHPEVPEEFAFVTEGLLHGTSVATPTGWRRVEELAVGERLLSFDGAPCVVVGLQVADVADNKRNWPANRWPLTIPPGAMGNRETLRLLPDQPILLHCDMAERLFGDAFALIPAAALVGWRGIGHEPPQANERVVTPILTTDAVIYASGGALVWCPGDTAAGLPGFPALPDRADGRCGHASLSLCSARELVACLIAEDMGAALMRAAPGGDHAALRVLEP